MIRSSLFTWSKNVVPGPARQLRPALESLEQRVVMNGSLVAAYNFDAGSGTTLADVSGNGNNGTISNAQWATGKYGGALTFNGAANSLVTVADSPSLDLSNGMTLEAWLDPWAVPTAHPGGLAILAKQQSNSSQGLSYGLDAALGPNGTPAGTVLTGGNSLAASGSTTLPLDHWVFLATTYDGTTLKTYVNGSLVSSQALSGAIQTNGGPLTIGGDALGQNLQGKISNVRIYNYALSQAQIQTDMNTPVTGTAPQATSTLGAFSAMQVPWSSGNVHCTLADPTDQYVFFGLTSGAVWRLNEATGTWTNWQTPYAVMSLALAGPGLVEAGVGYGPTRSSVYQINESTGAVTQAAISDGKVLDWQLLGTAGGVLAFDSYNGNVFRSTDGGLTFQQIASPGAEMVYTCFQAADGAIYMGGEGPYRQHFAAPLVSHDGGLTWQSAGMDSSNSKSDLLGLGQANNGDILVGRESCGGEPVQRISSNGVVTVSSTGLPKYTYATHFAAVGNNTVLVSLWRYGAVVPPMVSFDDGHTWQKISSLPTTANSGGFAVTDQYVYYYTDCGLYRAVK